MICNIQEATKRQTLTTFEIYCSILLTYIFLELVTGANEYRKT